MPRGLSSQEPPPTVELGGQPTVPTTQVAHEPTRPVLRPLKRALHQEGDVEDQNGERCGRERR